jgi:hypothetical protein
MQHQREMAAASFNDRVRIKERLGMRLENAGADLKRCTSRLLNT